MSPLDPNAAELVQRIERGQATSYWEQNLVDGRRAAIARLLAWLQPLEGRRVMALGLTAAELCALESQGAQIVTAQQHHDSVPPDKDTEDAEDAEDTVLWEVLERLEPPARRPLLQQIEQQTKQRLFLAIRVASRWGRLASAAELPTGEPIELLREVHLETGLRLARDETLTRRNSVLRICQLERPDSFQK